ncbi:MAG: protein-tyrosine phosphatase family protein [Terriglobales bacterium]
MPGAWLLLLPLCVDFDFILDRRLAVGGGLWTLEAMAELSRRGFTHIVDVQAEFDDTELASEVGLEVLWNPVEDDGQPKPAVFFDRAVAFAARALSDPLAQVYVHCAAGIHRGPLAAAAILCALGFRPEDAMSLIVTRRPGADFPSPYRYSLLVWATARHPQRSTMEAC